MYYGCKQQKYLISVFQLGNGIKTYRETEMSPPSKDCLVYLGRHQNVTKGAYFIANEMVAADKKGLALREDTVASEAQS